MNLIKICTISLFSTVSLVHSAQQPYDALIPLGGDCQLAWQMRINGLRQQALPLDWSITSPEALMKVLDNKFHDYLNSDNLEYVENGTEKYILEKKYGVSFVHEFKREKNFLDTYAEVKEKCDRRIDRFFKIIEECKNPLFIRKGITKEQAITLTALINNKLVPGKKFQLLALDTNEEIKETWNCLNIVNYYVKQPDPYVWDGDYEAWKEIFTKVGLKLGTKDDSCKDL